MISTYDWLQTGSGGFEFSMVGRDRLTMPSPNYTIGFEREDREMKETIVTRMAMIQACVDKDVAWVTSADSVNDKMLQTWVLWGFAEKAELPEDMQELGTLVAYKITPNGAEFVSEFRSRFEHYRSKAQTN